MKKKSFVCFVLSLPHYFFLLILPLTSTYFFSVCYFNFSTYLVISFYDKMKLVYFTSSGMFFDSYFGSIVETIKIIPFTFHKESLIQIDEICAVNTTGSLDVVG